VEEIDTFAVQCDVDQEGVETFKRLLQKESTLKSGRITEGKNLERNIEVPITVGSITGVVGESKETQNLQLLNSCRLTSEGAALRRT
jgi:hypothetical protein